MKKLLSVILAIVMVFGSVSVCFATENSNGIYPTIIVAGYSSSSLYTLNEDGSRTQVWGVDVDEIMSMVLHNIARIGRGLGELAFGKPELVAEIVGKAIVDMYGVLAYNENGESVNKIETFSSSAEKTQFSYLLEHENGEHMHESVIMDTVREQYEKIYGVSNGNDYIFSYQTDFRQNIIDCAADLDRFIDSVLAFTGAKKVNIYAVSHGGEVTATYLSIYGKDKKAVNNAVLTVPAIGGAALASDLMSENIVFDEETLFYFIENGMMFEYDLNWLVRANQFGILDDICNIIMSKYAKDVLGYWGSIWDFIYVDFYDELKKDLPEATLNSDMIRKSNLYHYEIYPRITESFKECEEAGINIYTVAGFGNPSVTGLQEQSDGIITVTSSTGSKTAPYGKRFSDGYIQLNSVCKDTSHNHLSPDMTVDASCAYLPDTTWLINGLFHGMTWHDDYSKSLCCELLFSDTHKTVFDYKQYPQFKYSTNRCHSVTATFDSSKQGYISSDDEYLTVTNISHEYKMRLYGVTFEGADLKLDLSKPVILEPEESVKFKVSGSVPQTSLTTVDITVSYKLIGSITPYGSRTMVFTVMNGTAPDYEGGYTDALRQTRFDESVNESNTAVILEKTGLYDLLKMFFEIFSLLLTMFGRAC